MLDLSLNNHESNVVCVIPSFLITLKSSFKAGFSLLLFASILVLVFSFGAFESRSLGTRFSQTLGPRPQNARYSDLFFFVFAHDVFA